jgi:hypothetical protein
MPKFMPKFVRGNSGQALVETLLLMPLLLAIILNAINFGYLCLMALDITSSTRSSGLYSIMGSATPATPVLPLAGSFSCATLAKTVSDLACQDLTGAVYSPSTTNTGINICSPSVGVLNQGLATQQSACITAGSVGSFGAAEPDPELNSSSTVPAFYLNRVDIAYQFTPPIPSMPFNLMVLAVPGCTSAPISCTFYRHIEMRVMGP